MSLKQRIFSLIPSREKLEEDRVLRHIARFMSDPNLWHINRRAATGAIGIGFACAWILPPFQLTAAALAAIYFRKNLPLTIAATWITNPITFPPMLYFAYLLGGNILSIETVGISNFIAKFEDLASSSLIDAFRTLINDFGLPLLIGSTISAIFTGLTGYCGSRLLWRMHVMKKWHSRNQKRLNRITKSN